MASSLEMMRGRLSAALADSEPGLPAADALCTSCVGLFGVDGAALSVVLGGTSSGTFGSSSAASRRLDEYQFTFGEGPCLDAVATRRPVLVPDLDEPQEQRWPMLRGALLDDGIRGVFAMPVMVTSVCVGALDLFRARPGPLAAEALAGARLAAELVATPLLEIIEGEARRQRSQDEGGPGDPADPGDVAHPSGDQDDLRAGEVDRIEVYQATGMLIAQLDVDAEEAVLRLRAHAIATGQTASEVARKIVARELVLDRDEPTGPGGTARSDG